MESFRDINRISPDLCDVAFLAAPITRGLYASVHREILIRAFPRGNGHRKRCTDFCQIVGGY